VSHVASVLPVPERARPVLLSACVAAIAAVAVAIEHRSVHGALVSASTSDGLLEAVAGAALAGAAFAVGARRGREQSLLFAAAAAWFVAEWNNPGGSAVTFTIGLATGAVAPAVVAHAALSLPTGRLGAAAERAGVRVSPIHI